MILSHCQIKTILVLLLLSAYLSVPLSAFAENEYAGAYSDDLVWSDEVTMAADVLIREGASLTIRAGTTVNIIPAAGTKIDPEYLSSQTELLIRGRLNVQGTDEAPVRFVVLADADDDEYAWSGITLDSATESRISYAVLERADIAIRCVASSPQIVGNRIKNCRYGIITQQQSHPEIIDNSLADGEGGIFCWRGSNPRIENNLLTGHDEEALFVDARSQPSLGENIISGNAVGLALYPRDLDYEQVVLQNNHESLRWLGRQGQGGE